MASMLTVGMTTAAPGPRAWADGAEEVGPVNRRSRLIRAPFGPDAGALLADTGLHPETRKAFCASKLVWGCIGRAEMLLKSSFFRGLPTLRSCREY
jgi:hypothetical protein